jgi:ribosomal protein L16 Arg81 hydroxylase
MLVAKLIAGDWLYIPRRWWHLVKCSADSLSISVGIMPPAEMPDAWRIPRGWAEIAPRS